MTDENKSEWELITRTPVTNCERLKVDGGHIYRTASDVKENGISESLVFVPDIDLTRYQAHLRDAYNQGFKDGSGEIRMEPNTTAYNRGYEDAKKDIEFESQKVVKNV